MKRVLRQGAIQELLEAIETAIIETLRSKLRKMARWRIPEEAPAMVSV